MKSVEAYRLANWDTPLWANPNRREGRFGREGDIVQYWALHPLTPWAEQLRFHGIRTVDEARELRLRPWVARVPLLDDAPIITFDTAEEHGVDPEVLINDDWGPCQAWAASLAVSAIVVPSAALPGTSNLVMFGPRVRSLFGVEPFDPAVDVPCTPYAQDATVIGDLLPFVRFRGSAHADYEAWVRGASVSPPHVTP